MLKFSRINYILTLFYILVNYSLVLGDQDSGSDGLKNWYQNQYHIYPDYGPEYGDSVLSTTPRTKHSQITLSATSRTQHVFNILTNDSTFGFELLNNLPQVQTRNYKINVVIEKLTWTKWDRKETDKHPCILIQGVNEDNEIKEVKFCYEIHNAENSFQTVRETMSDMTSATVSAEGDWTRGTSATLVASIYYEVGDSCENCANGYFCCGIEGSTCSTNRQSVIWGDEVLYRCIPITNQQYRDRNSDTICNSHPNCGFFCNSDESPEQCRNGSEHCFGGDCNLANVALRIAVLVIFCFLLPPVIILFLCRFNSVRTACRRLRGRIMAAGGHRDSDVTIGSEATEPSVGGVPTISRRNRGSSQTYYADDDPPPSYEEYLRHFKEIDTPIPVPIISSNNNTSEGTANPSDFVISGVLNANNNDIPITCHLDLGPRLSRGSDVGLNRSVNGRALALNRSRNFSESEVGVAGAINLGFVEDEPSESFS